MFDNKGPKLEMHAEGAIKRIGFWNCMVTCLALGLSLWGVEDVLKGMRQAAFRRDDNLRHSPGGSSLGPAEYKAVKLNSFAKVI
ncbi:unnamed protein product [Protopolystoma xenopodis]|uniref:Uncharacterized protein n=1 Tax=Protopolystoma xenopodis TaxID=117903 RepID=A0A448XAI4_9PLAT|nr:unnamed protein product [Protopolystoma xenopodis]